ncbi:hypothetical protein A1Q2_06660 [Trichosporon asahii var. asahii CBS 8904]|uniref:Uncharacterized protein n=1 Tax=Trichosporon asahii var. asahii (strain CBS 8904) TaxID=1220162 RepID=K1VID8_TRIAC|nr:hypothetical protein A1Q2_06660 [Trichosporon asahii var. asahii CBS 8904]
MVKQEPSTPPDGPIFGDNAVTGNNRPDIEIILKDNELSERVITVTQYTFSGSKSTVSLKASTDSNAQVACVWVLTTRILITKGISSQATAAPPSDIEPRQMNPLDSASTALPADRKPVITPSRARCLTSPHHLAAHSSSSRVSPKALAVGRSTPKVTDSSKDKGSKLTVIVYDYKYNYVHIQALRSDRIADVLQRYATTKGLNFDSLSLERR